MQRQKFLNKKTSTVKFPKKSEKISPSKRLSHHLKIPFQKKLRPQKGGGLDLKKKKTAKPGSPQRLGMRSNPPRPHVKAPWVCQMIQCFLQTRSVSLLVG